MKYLAVPLLVALFVSAGCARSHYVIAHENSPKKVMVKNRGRGALRGLAIGVAAGALTGAAFGYAVGEEPCESEGDSGYGGGSCGLFGGLDNRAMAKLFAAGGAVAGALHGTIAGHLIGVKEERIAAESAPTVMVAPTKGGGHVGLGFSF